MRERVTVSLDSRIANRVRQCGAQSSGGASGYLERLVRQDEMHEAVAAMERWHSEHPDYADNAEAERIAVAAELGEAG